MAYNFNTAFGFGDLRDLAASTNEFEFHYPGNTSVKDSEIITGTTASEIRSRSSNNDVKDGVAGARRTSGMDRGDLEHRGGDHRHQQQQNRNDGMSIQGGSTSGAAVGHHQDGGMVSVTNGNSNSNQLPPSLWAASMMAAGYPMVSMNMIMDPTAGAAAAAALGMMPAILPPPAAMMMSAATPANDAGVVAGVGASGNAHSVHTDQTSGMVIPQVQSGSAVMKDFIHCKSCTLLPPNPNAPPPTTRERPSGCRTVFVGGLPENMTEEIIMEVFERCGEISTLRLSKKTFCHIRFVYESSVDAAIFLSGYRIRIGSNLDPPNTGRLHVDYAQARDDQYEWECKQRQLQREQRHRERMVEERLRPPSPPPVVHYTEHEAAAILEKIKLDDTFTKAVQVVITWLERGDCHKRNASNFYSMIQSTNSHVRRLIGEKAQYEDELDKAKEILKGRMQGILLQFSQIERLFLAACHKKVWDHFTKAQRKNIEGWKKQSLEIKNIHSDCDITIRSVSSSNIINCDDDEMDLSDGDESAPSKKARVTDNTGDEAVTVKQLRDENCTVRCQLEAYKNEVVVIKADMKNEVESRQKEIVALNETVDQLRQQLADANRKRTDDKSLLCELRAELLNSKSVVTSAVDNAESVLEQSESGSSNSNDESVLSSAPSNLTDLDAKLICIISTFLNVHPFGAGLDYIWSYVSKLTANVRPTDLELLMNRFPAVFNQKVIGIGANIERRWLFNAYKSSSSTTPQ